MSEIILSNEQISVARYPENGVIRVNGDLVVEKL